MRRSFLLGTLAAVAAIFGAGAIGAGSGASEAAPPPQIASALGRVQIAGQEVYVHVTVTAPTASQAERGARAELARQGAAPVAHAAYTTNGKGIKRFTDNNPGNDHIVVTFFGASAPAGLGFDPRAEFVAGVEQWNGVEGSNFDASVDPVDTTTCPSLVAACPGSQTLDGEYGTGFLDLGGVDSNGSLTLGVTYFCYRGKQCEEADMVLNSNAASPWVRDVNNTGNGDFDMRTVAAHEFGHMWAIGHSQDTAALMYPYYHGGMWTLAADDEAALVHLYPASSGDGGGDTGSSWCDTHDSSHPAWSKKGCA